MVDRVPHACPGCGVATRTPRCGTCTATQRRDHDTRRGSASTRGYNAQWRRVRARILAMDPLCRMCSDRARPTLATEVDHIDGDSRNNADANLRPLCKSCHSRRTRHDQDPRVGR